MTSYKLVDFKTLGDERVSLIALKQGYNIPFVYYIFDTKYDVERGFCAHVNLKQIAIAVKGSCISVLDDGEKRKEITLSNPNQGLLAEGLIWREMRNFSSDCVLVVLPSEYYVENDNIKNYDKFLKVVKI